MDAKSIRKSLIGILERYEKYGNICSIQENGVKELLEDG
jgi:hypothetical protein